MSEQKNKPVFSVLMANYNNAEYIEEAIKSVLKQTVCNWELIIIDDCSTDNSVNIINKYLDDTRIIFFKNESNLGYIKTLKRMFGKANSDLTGILDSDDSLDKEALEIIIQAYKSNPDNGFVYSQCYYCDKNLLPQHLGFSQKIPVGKTNLHVNTIHHFKTFRKSLFNQTEGYNDEIRFAEDIDLHFKLEEVAQPFFLDKPLYYYRILPKSQTHSFKNIRINRSSTALAKLNAYKRRLNTNIPNLNKPEIAEVLFWGIINALLAGRFKLALKFKFELFKYHPFYFLDYGFYQVVINKVKKLKKLKQEKVLLNI